jgi:hypothetical protein
MLKLIVVPDDKGPTVEYIVPESISRATLKSISAEFNSSYAGNFAARCMVQNADQSCIKGQYPAEDVGAGRTSQNRITWGGTGTAYNSVDGTSTFAQVPMMGIELQGGDVVTLAGNTGGATDGWSNINLWVDVGD